VKADLLQQSGQLLLDIYRDITEHRVYKEIIYLCEAWAVVVCGATQSEALSQLFARVVTLLQTAVAAATAGEEASLGTEGSVHTACQRVAANSKTATVSASIATSEVIVGTLHQTLVNYY